jgi:DNA invertase Pin-like site-specific DNA recombinase
MPRKRLGPRKYRIRTNAEAVKEMRLLFWKGVPVPQIAKQFGISYPYCWQICNFYRLRKEPPPPYIRL